MKRGSLRSLLLLGFLANTLVAILCLALLARFQVRVALEELAAESFGLIAEEVGFNLDRVLSKAVADLRMVARDPVLSDPGSGPDERRAALSRLKELLGGYEDLTLVGPDGEVLASSDYNFRGAWKHKQHFIEAAAGGVSISSAHFIPFPRTPVLGVAGPVTDNRGRVSAVVALQLSLYELSDIVRHVRLGGTGHALLIDGHGRYLSHPREERLLTRVEPRLLAGIEAASGRIAFATPEGRRLFGAVSSPHGSEGAVVTPGRRHDLRVVVLQDEAELFDVLRTVTWQISGFAAVLFAAAVFLALRFSEAVTAPVARLIDGARRIGRGDFEHRVEVSAVDEIADLASSFNRMARELRVARSYLGHVFDALPSALMGIGNDARVFHWSSAAEALTGRPAERAVGANLFEAAPFLEPYREAVAAVIEERRSRVFERRPAALDGERYLDVAIFPLAPDSGGAVIRVDDVTAQELRDAQLLQAQKMEVVGSLAGGLSHDFNNALTAIVGLTDLLRHAVAGGQGDPSWVLGKLELIEEAARTASATVERLLSFSRPRAAVVEPIDLNGVAERVADICRSTFDKGIEIRTRPSPVPALVLADAGLIQQALLNLCLNAAHAMTLMRGPGEPRGGLLELTLEERAAEIRDRDPDGGPARLQVLSVRDTGVGMTPEVARRAFEPFFTTKRQDQGTGLGLAMVCDIVAKAGGVVAFHSIPGEGTTFEIRLPARPALNPAMTPAAG